MARAPIITGVIALSIAGCGPVPAGWAPPQHIEVASSLGYYVPRVAVGSRGGGGVSALWATSSELRSTRFSADGPLAGLGAHIGHEHALAVADDGAVMVLYRAPGGLVWRRHAGRGGSWSPAEVLDFQGVSPSLAADGAGNVLAAWRSGEELRAARYVSGSGGWQAATTIRRDLVGPDSGRPDVSMGADGAGVVAWCGRGPAGPAIFVARYRTGFFDVETLAEVPACIPRPIAPSGEIWPHPQTVDAATSDTGVMTVVWTDGNVRTRRFERPAGGGAESWTPAETLWTPAEPARGVAHLRVAVNGAGDAVAAWQTHGEHREQTLEVFAATYAAAGRTWTAATSLGPLTRNSGPFLGVVIDERRRALVLRHQTGSTVLSHRHDGTSFLPAVEVTPAGVYEFDLTMTSAGIGFLLFTLRNSDLNLSVFLP